MLVSKLETLVKSLETQSVVGGIEYLEIIQFVVDELFADDSYIRLLKPAPYVTTINAQTEYTFEELFTTYVDSEGITTIRKIRGIWEEALSPTDATLQDYGRQYVPEFEQKDFYQRVYDGEIKIDNELMTVTFDANPTATTDKWKVDMWKKAPRLLTTDTLPILHGWEKRILIPGIRSYFEELDKGKPGPHAAAFADQKLEYRYALEKNAQHLDQYTSDLGFQVDPFVVERQ